MSNRRPLLASLQQQVDEALRPLVATAPAVALLDFPDFANVGDSAIWLGALATLARIGAPAPCYTSDARTYDRRALARRLGGGTILLNGGGSLGDLWPRHQRFREQVVTDFPDNPVVQLPQSLHFTDAAALAQARAVFNRHPRLTLLLRDAHSLAAAREHFQVDARLAPDLAFGLGAPPAIGAPRQAILWLKRDDIEARWPMTAVPAQVAVTDWVEEARTPLLRWHDALARTWASGSSGPRTREVVRVLLSRTHAPLARQRLQRGWGVLGGARVVVTDRLHGHILCLLMGKPHVVLDNSYRKLSGFIETWTGASPLVRLVDTPEAAVHQALASLNS